MLDEGWPATGGCPMADGPVPNPTIGGGPVGRAMGGFVMLLDDSVVPLLIPYMGGA